ncbi:MAG: Rsd/AlgQ family anti-sigma factor [Methylococcus sp.]|nr:Rsd/AlgQ family anti-sigma factor [Methylococcus sp.]
MPQEATLEHQQPIGDLVKELLDERRQVWLAYSELGGLKPFAPSLSLESRLRGFCQILIDYISLGHFGLYRRVTNGTEVRANAAEVADAIYPGIAEATDAAMAFNDKYERMPAEFFCEELEDDLSRLGERLALRGELEDRLIASLTG